MISIKKVICKKKERNGNIFVSKSYTETTVRHAFARDRYSRQGTARILTVGAERPRIRGEGAVTPEPAGLFSASPSIATQLPVAAAVAPAAGLHSGSDLGSLLQVQGQPVQLQRPDASQEAPLPGGRPTYEGNTANGNTFLGV